MSRADSRIAVFTAPRESRTGRAGGAARGFADPGGDRPVHRTVGGHGLQHRPRAQGRWDRRGHGHLGRRPAGAQRLAQRRRGHRDRRGLRPHAPAGGGRQPRPPGPGRGIRPAGRGRFLGGRLRPGRSPGRRADRGHRSGPGQGHRRGARRPRPHRRGVRDPRLHRDPAGLGRDQPAARALAAPRRARVRGQRRQPRSARGAGVGERPGSRTSRTSRWPAASAPAW